MENKSAASSWILFEDASLKDKTWRSTQGLFDTIFTSLCSVVLKAKYLSDQPFFGKLKEVSITKLVFHEDFGNTYSRFCLIVIFGIAVVLNLSLYMLLYALPRRTLYAIHELYWLCITFKVCYPAVVFWSSKQVSGQGRRFCVGMTLCHKFINFFFTHSSFQRFFFFFFLCSLFFFELFFILCVVTLSRQYYNKKD